MATIVGDARIRTNISAENAYNALTTASQNIAQSQLRISTGKRINSASDDLAGYITSRSLTARNGALKSSLLSVGDALNVTQESQDSLDNISSLLTTIKDSASSASSGSLGTDEKVALAKGAYRLAQQIQTVVDQTIFGGKQLLATNYSGDFIVGWNNTNSTALKISINLTTTNTDFNTNGASGVVTNNFNSNALSATAFAGVSGLDLTNLNTVSATNLGIFSTANIETTLTSLSTALDNVSKVASYLGGIQTRLNSQNDLINSQVTNYDAAISRIENTDVAQEQLNLVKSQFLQQASLTSLAQANQNPSQFLQLLR
jgi:flagellin